ncbi:hypothetical protein, partial [Terribacillus saccharophilus]|uniref:hypothetical protein n=1 Tax=Terribacillus saccharophilus TaxID=361277 RepID=UPI0020D196C1
MIVVITAVANNPYRGTKRNPRVTQVIAPASIDIVNFLLWFVATNICTPNKLPSPINKIIGLII